MKRIFALGLSILMLFALIGCQKTLKSDAEQVSCTFTINAGTAYANEGLSDDIRALLKNEGMLAKAEKLSMDKGSNAGDALKTFCREHNIALNAQQSEYGTYVIGIGGLDLGACGEMSYWLLKVNGEFADTGADQITINDGDTYEWIFTCDGGADVGYNWES